MRPNSYESGYVVKPIFLQATIASRCNNSGFVLFINMEFGRGGHAQGSTVGNDVVDSESS